MINCMMRNIRPNPNPDTKRVRYVVTNPNDTVAAYLILVVVHHIE